MSLSDRCMRIAENKKEKRGSSAITAQYSIIANKAK